jgi:hypothetical protein
VGLQFYPWGDLTTSHLRAVGQPVVEVQPAASGSDRQTRDLAKMGIGQSA